MIKFHESIIRFFDKIILKRPGAVVLCLLGLVAFLFYHAKDFRLDASAETLVLQNDQNLKFSRKIDARYNAKDFLVMTYSPRGDLLSSNSLDQLARLREVLLRLEGVESVLSLLNVPLLESPPVPIKELATKIQTLASPTVDRELARIELSESPVYRNLIVSPDLRTTALQINLPADEMYGDLLNRRNRLRDKKTSGSLSEEETIEFEKVAEEFQQYRDKMKAARHEKITKIRGIMDPYRKDAELFLGGVSMIADDMISFIKSDLKIFGLGVFFFLVVTLGIIFRRIRWIFIPMLCCAFAAISMIGLLGWFDWEVTVISSNFISLQLIITMAIAMHLIVRYQELHRAYPDMDQRQLVLETIRLKLRPCSYAALTTIAGFGSLLFCDILPVITFGWMMTAGISVSLVLTFLLFPALLMFMEKEPPRNLKPSRFSMLSFLARFTENHGRLILTISGVTLVLSAVGITRLEVENSFIDYFKDTTEIYQGMKVIDQQLGGTTPLDVVIDLEPADVAENDAGPAKPDDVFSEFDEFEKPADDKKYWFTPDKMARVTAIHDYLDSLPETGKVMSLGTMLKMAEKLNDGKSLDNFQLALLYTELPEAYKHLLLNPYVAIEKNQLRFSVRVRDSEKSLRRDTLLKKIHRDLVEKLHIDPERIHLTGVLVLYNNMLQNLFDSQILTLGLTVAALIVMFLILFRSVKIALIAIFPNLLSIGVVLGFMGWIGIPLDMMTITIAAISVGIAVDDTIHYIHRFMQEFDKDRNYILALHRCHGSIGYAMYYTSVTIIIGFSILVLSNFIPSIYFGFLTGLAMFVALVAALTLLPQLLIAIKPLGPEAAGVSS
jgi:uncharacterized protein